MKGEQIKQIKNYLILKTSSLDNNSTAAFLIGARSLIYSLQHNNIITHEDWEKLSDMIGTEINKCLKLAKQP